MGKLRSHAILALLFVAVLALAGLVRVRSWVQNDLDFCTSCHRQSPEFAVWKGGAHASLACQRCHHASVDEGLATLRTFIEGGPMDRKQPHGAVEIGTCASCHLSHDKQWADVGASRGHRLHAIEHKIACVRCHAASAHRFVPVVASCKECHGEHAVRASGMQEVHCFACHDFLSVERDLRPTRRDCLRCHRAEGIHPARFPEDAPMRFACASCHKPHAPKDQELVACSTCHDKLPKAGLHAKAGHRDCRACHRAHSWKSEAADCLRCHANAAAHAPNLNCSKCHGWGGSKGRPTAPRGT